MYLQHICTFVLAGNTSMPLSPVLSSLKVILWNGFETNLLCVKDCKDATPNYLFDTELCKYLLV